MPKERKTERKHLRAVASPSTPTSPALQPLPDGDVREQSIALDAYYRAERRGFAPGSELTDWLEAEAEFDAAAGRRISANDEEASAPSPDEFS